jgi:hypothetical protein
MLKFDGSEANYFSSKAFIICIIFICLLFVSGYKYNRIRYYLPNLNGVLLLFRDELHFWSLAGISHLLAPMPNDTFWSRSGFVYIKKASMCKLILWWEYVVLYSLSDPTTNSHAPFPQLPNTLLVGTHQPCFLLVELVFHYMFSLYKVKKR